MTATVAYSEEECYKAGLEKRNQSEQETGRYEASVLWSEDSAIGKR